LTRGFKLSNAGRNLPVDDARFSPAAEMLFELFRTRHDPSPTNYRT